MKGKRNGNRRGGSGDLPLASSGDSFRSRGLKGGRSRATVAGVLALGLAAAGLVVNPAGAIDSNPPTGPGNIEIFPKRDMVAIEGYGEYAGKSAEIKVLRGGTVIGSAKGTVDGTGFLEVNHPGGVCWGAGTNLQVTPDIRGTDEIRVDFLETGTPNKWDGAKTTAIEITDVARVEAGNKLVIRGTYGAGVDMPGTDLAADPGKIGVEIVNPDMRGGTSAVGERAIGWPEGAGEPLPGGYTTSGGVTSGTDATGGTFEVSFAFDQASDLDLAEAGEVVGLGWQAEAPPELGIEAFYGMTLFEYHESSGPGFGGCPAGPQEARPNSPTVYTAKGAGGGKIDVTWGAGSTLPEAAAITGYEVTAIRSVSTGLDAGGVLRTAADGRSATVEGLTAGEVYDVEIATRSSAGDSKPAVMRIRAAEHIVPTASATTLREPNDAGKYAPLVTNVNGDFGVHLDPAPGLIDAEVHYTTDGSTPTLKSDTFTPGSSDSLQIRQDTTVKWVVVDGGNIVGPADSKFFDIIETTEAAPAISSVVPATVSGAVDVTFNRLTDPTVDVYRVQTYNEAGTVRIGTPVNVLQPETGETVVRRVTELTNGTKYTFTVAARYGTVFSNESALSTPVAPEAPSAAVAGPDQTVLRARTFTLDGGTSPKAVSYQWTQIRPTGTNGIPQDPAIDLNPLQAGLQSTTGAVSEPKLTLTMPLLTTPTSDHNLQFRLNTVHSDGLTRADLVDVKAQADTVVANEVRWRARDEIGGTGSQANARLTLMNGSAAGAVIGVAIVINGEWEYPAGTPTTLVGNKLYVWSDYGYTGTITVTR